MGVLIKTSPECAVDMDVTPPRKLIQFLRGVTLTEDAEQILHSAPCNAQQLGLPLLCVADPDLWGCWLLLALLAVRDFPFLSEFLHTQPLLTLNADVERKQPLIHIFARFVLCLLI